MLNLSETSLEQNFAHMVAMLRSGNLSEENFRQFSHKISNQVASAEILARRMSGVASAANEHAQNILGYPRREPELAIPKPRPLEPIVSRMKQPLPQL